MANKDFFKQAIAEAKSIREAAIANAKEALEETLTPHLKDMLAAKLQEMDDSAVEEEVVNESEEVAETIEEAPAKGEDEMEEGKHEDEMEEGKHEDEMEEAIEEAPVEEAPGEDAEDADAEGDSEESEDEAEDGEEEIEVKDMEVDDLKDLIRDIIAQEHEKMGLDGGEDHSDMDAGEMEPEMGDIPAAEDEEIDLDELLAELDEISEEEANEGKHEDEMEEGKHKEEMEEEVIDEVKEESVNEDNSELNQALETIETLQAQLSEVNLLNAKLMYVNKVFKANNLSEGQKVNVIAAFDKAETVKEVKLVFETVSDNVIAKAPKSTIKESKLGSASKATGTTAAKPEVINEVSDVVKRMQKLAGIK